MKFLHRDCWNEVETTDVIVRIKKRTIVSNVGAILLNFVRLSCQFLDILSCF